MDTSVIRRIGKFETTIYRLRTFTGVFLNWMSLIARRYKINVIHCLAERLWRICREEAERKTEIQKLKLILKRNKYPTEVIEMAINRRPELNKQHVL